MKEIKLTAANFKDEVLNSKVPVLVDFWASWCGPCRMMSPVVSEIADEYDGRVKVGKVNVDEEPALASAFRIMSIPAFMVFENGKVKNSTVGVQPKANLERMIL